MKALYLIVQSVLIPIILIAQVVPSQRRTITTTFPIYKSDLRGRAIDTNQIFSAPDGFDFIVIREAESDHNYFIVEFPLFNENTQQHFFYKYNYDQIVYNKYSKTGGVTTIPKEDKKFFAVLKSDIESNSKIKYSRAKSAEFTAGALTIPIKLRLENFDFTSNISLGINGGIKWRISKYNEHYFSLLLGGNIAAVDLDSFTTNGLLVKEPVKNIAVFSPTLGLIFEFNGIQAGITIGMDYLSSYNQNKYEWIYQGKPWIGFGIGVAIFNKNGEKTKETNSSAPQPVK